MSTRAGYSSLQVALHWLVAILVLATWWFSEGMGRLLDARLESGATGFTGTPLHVWLGLTLLVVVVVRFLVRLTQGAPDPVSETFETEGRVAKAGHWLLYLLLFAVPLAGITTWFIGIDAVGEPHQLMANGLLILAGLHALVALWHHYGRHDGTLMRMLRPVR